jgi:hypothetical protein
MNILDYRFNHKLNVIKLSKHETREHSLAKCLTCIELLENGVDFYTEAIFNNGKRADIYCPKKNTAYEIVKSETKESIENKKKEYPCEIIFLGSRDIIKHWGVR